MMTTDPVTTHTSTMIRNLDDFMSKFMPEAMRQKESENQSAVEINAQKLAQAVLSSIAPNHHGH